MGDQVVLTEIGQQAGTEQRETHQAGKAAGDQDTQQRTRPALEPGNRAELPALEIPQKGRLRGGLVTRHRQGAQRWRRAHRDQQGQPDRDQKSDRQRPEERALEAGHHQDRQEGDSHGGRRVEHRAPDFERSGSEQLADVDAPSAAAAAAQYVFNINHRIVDDHAQRDDQAAERHSVQTQPKGVQNPDSRQQREGYCAERNQRTAPIAQRHHQQRHDQRGADQQRVAQLLDGAFDEARRPKQSRMIDDPLLGELSGERIQPLLERQGHIERIGAELGRRLDHDARLAGNQGIAKARLGSVAYRGEIAESHR